MRNYLIGWQEVGWDTISVETHFREEFKRVGMASNFSDAFERVAREASSPLGFFDGVFCLNLDTDTDRWAAATRRHDQLDAAWQVERFPAVATPDNHHRGNAMSFRRMVAEAKRRDFEHVLILEDDAVFIDDALAVLRSATLELPEIEWDLCYLGACVWSQVFPFVPGSAVLQACGPVTCTHAVAIHRRAYDRILAEIPTDTEDFARWLDDYLACDQYLSRRIADGTFRAVIISPRIASQPALLGYEDADRALADRYVI